MHLFSATQIELFGGEEGCERKWGFRYISGIKGPQHPAAALGTEVDDEQLQPYLREGKPLDFSRASRSGEIANSALVHLPPPGSARGIEPFGFSATGIEVQRHFVLPSPDGDFGFQGYEDLWVPSGGMPGTRGDVPVIGDFKTCGSWRYIKNEKTLATNVQSQLYATAAMYETGYRTIDLEWIYMLTKGKAKSRRVSLRVHADHVAEQFSKINATASRMQRARKTVTNPLELEPNPDMCGAFGGCPHSSICNLSPSQTIDSLAARARARMPLMTTGTNSLIEKMKAQRAAALGGASAPTVPVDTSGPIVPYYAKGAIPIANLPSHVVGINPPESALPPAPPVGSVVATQSTPPTQTLQPAIPGDPADAGQIAADRGVAATEAPARRGPGRPKKTGPEAAAALVSAIEGTVTNVSSHPHEIRVVWAKESVWPDRSAGFEIGPFETTGIVQPGETVATAQARLYAELVAFAEQARAEKATRFKTFLDTIGGSR